MAKVKTAELIGPALNWVVGKCESRSVMRCGAGPSQYLAYVPPGKRSPRKWEPSTNWRQGGEIIDRELINLHSPTGEPTTAWCASRGQVHVWGATALIAAMRCYCLDKLGGEIDIPEELL